MTTSTESTAYEASVTGHGSQADIPSYSWLRALAVNFAPGVVTVALTLLLAPLAETVGLPSTVGYTIGIGLVTVLEIWFLRRVAFRATGFRGLRGAVQLTRHLSKWRVAVYSLGFVAMTAGLAGVLSPVSDALSDATSWLPANLSPELVSGDVATYGRVAVVLALVANWLLDAVVNPVVEEMYWKGNLMPRLPVRAALQPLVIGVLFAGEHFWEPADFVLVALAQIAISWHAWRSRSLDVAITTHILVNTLVTATTAVAILS